MCRMKFLYATLGGMKKLSKALKVHVTQTEYKTVETKAEKSDSTISNYVRTQLGFPSVGRGGKRKGAGRPKKEE